MVRFAHVIQSLCFVSLPFPLLSHAINNVCKSYLDYPTREWNKNCHYDPLVSATISELIVGYGYNYEEFSVITEDGYVLSLYRLMRKSSDSAKAGVLLLHGATVSGSNWVDKPTKRSLAFRLCERNFDVWIANFRGTNYSNKHVRFSGDSSEYWNYSFHEMGIYDIPAMLDTIYQRNGGEKVFLIGVSMGGTAATIYASLKPKHSEERVKAVISISGSIFFTGMSSIYKHLAPIVYNIYKFGDSIGFRDITQNSLRRFTLLRDFLTNFPPARILVWVFAFSTFGYDTQSIHEGSFPSLLGHIPAGISLKTILHYAQLITKGDKFDFFDNGPKDNLKIYGVSSTPAYPLENINSFFYIIAGGNDTLVTPQSCRKFYNLLAEDKRKMDIIEGYNHGHFLYGEDLDKPTALMQTVITVAFAANNICKSYLDYPTKEVNENCYYDPMISASVPELVIGYGYGFEEFEVITEDGYVLSLMHLTRNNSEITKASVLLLHGAAGSAANFVDKGPEVSLAFRLHDRNFDVWLGNFRGNPYSKSHKYHDTDSSEYWNFSMHEIGIYDIPAMLEIVAAKTDGRKVFVVGHSMGGTSSVIYASLRPEHAEKHVKAFVFMGISVFFTGIESSIKDITPYFRYFYQLGDSLGFRELLSLNNEAEQILAELALNVPAFRRIYMAEFYSIFGYDPDFFHEPTFPTFLSHNPSAVSLKILIHYAQLVEERVKFVQFDYGSNGNLRHYGQLEPPPYPIEDINRFIYVLVGERDAVVSLKGCKMFHDRLKEGMRKLEVVPGFNHLHFIYGKDLHVAYDPVIEFLENV